MQIVLPDLNPKPYQKTSLIAPGLSLSGSYKCNGTNLYKIASVSMPKMTGAPWFMGKQYQRISVYEKESLKPLKLRKTISSTTFQNWYEKQSLFMEEICGIPSGSNPQIINNGALESNAVEYSALCTIAPTANHFYYAPAPEWYDDRNNMIKVADELLIEGNFDLKLASTNTITLQSTQIVTNNVMQVVLVPERPAAPGSEYLLKSSNSFFLQVEMPSMRLKEGVHKASFPSLCQMTFKVQPKHLSWEETREWALNNELQNWINKFIANKTEYVEPKTVSEFTSAKNTMNDAIL